MAMELSPTPPKEKKRNNEKRKEKSRDAARNRRCKESEIFSSLSDSLPLPVPVVKHLDKASIMRLVIAHLRIRNIFMALENKNATKQPASDEKKEDSLFLPATGGFLLVLSLDGDILYISNNVSSFLGVSQIDLLGQSVYDVSHPCDHSELKDLLSGKGAMGGQAFFFMRMKCTMSSKSRNVISKSASYKVLKTSGRFIPLDDALRDKITFVALATPIPHPFDIEMPLGTSTFLSKHSLDMKFTYADEKMKDFLGYNPDKLVGKSMYDYHHVHDNKNIDKAFRSLFAKGQSETGEYRFLAQDGGYVWVSTQATIIYSDKTTKPESVVCVNYIISEKCDEDQTYSFDQFEYKKCHNEKEKKIVTEQQLPILKSVLYHSPRPRPATSKIFAPRTADMNKGFLMFSDDEPGITCLKDEPEDLTHLAPQAGGVCVSLETPLLTEVYNFLDDNSDPMSDPLATNDPLINRRKDTSLFPPCGDDLSRCSHSPSLTQSPDCCSVPSLIGLEESGIEDDNMNSLLDLAGVESEVDDINNKTLMSSLGESEEHPCMGFEFGWGMLNTPKSENSTTCSPLPEEDPLGPSWLDGEKDQKSSDMIVDTTTMIPEPERRKRLSSVEPDDVKKKKYFTLQDTDHGGGDSVLKNLLVNGCDLNSGYDISLEPRRPNSQTSNSDCS